MTNAKSYVVTEGNIAFDKDGKKCLEGDEIELTAEQAKALKDAGVVE
ncbi:hypothetical protein [Sphingopyxis sp. C-1]|nr:hypothetical protein [Sphingopyxis sp. C-1]GAO78657.1 hypothetical protein SC1_01966 [Sphingopyxis sp. C-1]